MKSPVFLTAVDSCKTKAQAKCTSKTQFEPPASWSTFCHVLGNSDRTQTTQIVHAEHCIPAGTHFAGLRGGVRNGDARDGESGLTLPWGDLLPGPDDLQSHLLFRDTAASLYLHPDVQGNAGTYGTLCEVGCSATAPGPELPPDGSAEHVSVSRAGPQGTGRLRKASWGLRCGGRRATWGCSRVTAEAGLQKDPSA